MLTALQETWPHLVYGTVLYGLAGMLLVNWYRLRTVKAKCEWERRGREEMEAYTRLDVRIPHGSDSRVLARKVCAVVAARSAFDRVAVLTRNEEGSLHLVATEGMDGAITAAVEGWLRRLRDQRGGNEGFPFHGVGIGTRSIVVRFTEAGGPISRAAVIPIVAGERRIGALFVCADSILQVPRRLAEEAVVSLEALAVKLAREMEREEADHYQPRVEKLAGKLMQLKKDPLPVVPGAIFGLREEAKFSVQKT